MAHCIECNKKIGWLKRAVEGAYCSEECRDRSLSEFLRREQELADERFAMQLAVESEERTRVRQRLELEAATIRATSEVVMKSSIGGAPCPRCGSPWSAVQGGGSFGRDRGDCHRCGYHAEYLAVEQCPNCRCQSLVVESEDDARCPRCKSRPRRRRQIA